MQIEQGGRLQFTNSWTRTALVFQVPPQQLLDLAQTIAQTVTQTIDQELAEEDRPQ